MKRKHVERSIAFVVITLYVLVMFGEGYAADPDVTLVVNPKSTEVYAGSGKIVITVDASGENLTFKWNLSGPGKLEDEGAAAFYSPPEKIDQESASAIVTVTVKEPSGQETVKSVAFTILPSQAETATPSPEPTSTEKKGMSRGTKVALGVGAVAALGGGAALAVSKSSSSSSSESSNVFTIDISSDKSVYHIGEKIVFTVQASLDCYLTLIDTDTQGNVTQIFPTQSSSDNFLRGGQVYRIPSETDTFDWIIVGPPGTEQVQAIAVTVDSTQRAEDIVSFQVIE